LPPTKIPGNDETDEQQKSLGKIMIAFTYCAIEVSEKDETEAITAPTSSATFATFATFARERLLIPETDDGSSSTPTWLRTYYENRHKIHQNCPRYGYRVISMTVLKDSAVEAAAYDEYCKNKYVVDTYLTDDFQKKPILYGSAFVQSILEKPDKGYDRIKDQKINLRPAVRAITLQLKRFKKKSDGTNEMSLTNQKIPYTAYYVVIAHSVCESSEKKQDICFEMYSDFEVSAFNPTASAGLTLKLHSLRNLSRHFTDGERGDPQLLTLKNEYFPTDDVKFPSGDNLKYWKLHENRFLLIYKELADKQTNKWDIFQKTVLIEENKIDLNEGGIRDTDLVETKDEFDISSSADIGNLAKMEPRYKFTFAKTKVENSVALNMPLAERTNPFEIESGQFNCWFGQLYESATQTCTKKHKCQVQECIQVGSDGNCSMCKRGWILSVDGRECIDPVNYPGKIDKKCDFPAERAMEFSLIQSLNSNTVSKFRDDLLHIQFEKELGGACNLWQNLVKKEKWAKLEDPTFYVTKEEEATFSANCEVTKWATFKGVGARISAIKEAFIKYSVPDNATNVKIREGQIT